MQTVGGRYAIEGALARGAGRVFRARHVQLDKAFALEVIAPPLARNEAARTRFLRDARLASDLSHPNLVAVVDFGEDPVTGPYVVTELVEGASLFGPTVTPFSPRRAFDMLTQLASGLEQLHRRGLVHGDLTADRVVVTSEADGDRVRSIVRLVDLGVGIEPELDATPQYSAPERVAGEKPTIGSDIYALGVLGFAMLAGRLPFEGSVAEVLRAQVDRHPPTIAELRGEPVDPAIEQLIARALAKHPDERHRNAAAFRLELDRVADKLQIDRHRISTNRLTAINPRDATVLLAFEHGGLAQAIVTPNGTITTANRAFTQLLGEARSVEGWDIAETSLATRMPDLVRVLRGSQRQRDSIELREAGLVVWIVPFSSEAVYVLARVEVS